TFLIVPVSHFGNIAPEYQVSICEQKALEHFRSQRSSADAGDQDSALIIPETIPRAHEDQWASSIKIGIGQVSSINCSFIRWPLDSKSRIVPSYAPRIVRRVNFRHLIKNTAIVSKCLEAMGHTFGNVQHSLVCC